MKRLPEATLYVNGSEQSSKAIELVSSLGFTFRRVPANGHDVPTLIIYNSEYLGLLAIELFASLYRSQIESERRGSGELD